MCQRTPREVGAREGHGLWTCSRCTYENDGQSNQCEVCFLRRRPSISERSSRALTAAVERRHSVNSIARLRPGDVGHGNATPQTLAVDATGASAATGSSPTVQRQSGRASPASQRQQAAPRQQHRVQTRRNSGADSMSRVRAAAAEAALLAATIRTRRPNNSGHAPHSARSQRHAAQTPPLPSERNVAPQSARASPQTSRASLAPPRPGHLASVLRQHSARPQESTEGQRVFWAMVPEFVTSPGWFFSTLPPERVCIGRVTPGSWAERSGLRVGDELREVDGQPLDGMTSRELVVALRRRPSRFLFRRDEDSSHSTPPRAEFASYLSDDGDEDEEIVSEDDDSELEMSSSGEEDEDEGAHVPEPPTQAHRLAMRAARPALSAMSVRGHEMTARTHRGAQPRADLVEPSIPSLIPQMDTHTITAEELSAREETEACCICLDEYCAGEKQTTLRCSHRFHSRCIRTWLCRSDLCPLCKQSTMVPN
mmetsp:Transcript_72163/g.200159  ORF Transcript_72163/g.200159 Transcript_72163/m.200159 type:complete len:483 (+) Transcript_72163:94-1542(+)